jgi:hypothetical protein
MLAQIATDRPPKRDIYQRARLFEPRSFTHHAKSNLNLVQTIVDRYSDPDDLVIDPMGGAGSILVALLTDRRVITGDVETQWAQLLRDNAQCLARQSLFPFFAPGLACQWDAANLPLLSGRVDLIITSPPYFDTFSDWDIKSQNLVDDDQMNEHGIAYGLHPRQIANVHVYENYLRAMLPVYRECWRILVPGGKLVLIIKDVIRGGRTLPIVDDNLSVALAAGFRLVERYDVPARGTRFRNVNWARIGQNGPEFEPVLVLERGDHHTKRRLALLELPQSGDGPGWIIARKARGHAQNRGSEIWTRSPDENEFHLTSGEKEFHPSKGERAFRLPGNESGFHPVTGNARDRRQFAFEMVRHLAVKAGLGTGDKITFYGSERYGQYICRRLETLGCTITKPLEGLNNGQRLRWLTNQNNTPGGDPCNKIR